MWKWQKLWNISLRDGGTPWMLLKPLPFVVASSGWGGVEEEIVSWKYLLCFISHKHQLLRAENLLIGFLENIYWEPKSSFFMTPRLQILSCPGFYPFFSGCCFPLLGSVTLLPRFSPSQGSNISLALPGSNFSELPSSWNPRMTELRIRGVVLSDNFNKEKNRSAAHLKE